MMLSPTPRATFPVCPNDTDELDDTLPIELLDPITNENCPTREMPQLKKVNLDKPTTVRANDRGTLKDSSLFDPPLSSTRYKSDGSSSECSDVSSTSGCGSAYEDEFSSGAAQKNSNRGQFIPPLLPTASMEFQPLRCSTAVTVNDLAGQQMPCRIKSFEIRVDTAEFKSLREQVQVQQTDSIEFNPLRCSTGLTTEDAVPAEDAAPESSPIIPTSPEEFYTACNVSEGISDRESDTHFLTALGITQTNSCAGLQSGQRSIESIGSAKSPADQNPAPHNPATPKVADSDNDLSILMQCHLKIRNGRQIISMQAKPQIELSVCRDSPSATARVPEAFKTKEVKSKIPSKRHSNPKQQDVDLRNQQPGGCDGSNNKPVVVESRIKLTENEQTNIALPSAIPTMTNLHGPNDHQKGKPNRGNSPRISGGRHPLEDENRIQRAMDNLATTNIQKMIPALAALDSARSALLCKSLVEQNLINNIYDFLLKMNRSVSHQMACVHATSLLLDLAKYAYSKDSTWKNGEKVGLMCNLMFIWASKDNAIFLNCATLLWVYCQDEAGANVVRRCVRTQNRFFEKISAKLGSKTARTTTQVPTLNPSWLNSEALRTFENPCSALFELSAVLNKKMPTLSK